MDATRTHLTTRRAGLVLGLVVVLFVTSSVAAFAYWSSTGFGLGDAPTAVLAPPTDVAGTSAIASGSVQLTWRASAGTPTPDGYFVTRNDGTGVYPACDSDPDTLLSGTSCTDPGLLAGSYTYVVTAVFDSWSSASAASAPILVRRGDQKITFTTPAPTNAAVEGSYTVAATGGASGNPVVFGTRTPLTCSVTDDVVTFTGAGSCTVTADQDGNDLYNPAPTATQNIAIAKATQAITFTSSAVNPTVGGSYTVTAVGGHSGNPVTFTSGTPPTCTVTGALVRFVGAGPCDIVGNQLGNVNYINAPATLQIVQVAKADSVLTFTSTPTNPAVATTYRVVVTGAPSGVPIVLASLTPSTCSVAGTTASFSAVGTCSIRATQAGNVNYNTAVPVVQTITVGKGSQTVTITSHAPSPIDVGGTYTILASSTSHLPVTFSSATPSVCTVAGSAVTMVGSGQCTVDADQVGNASYNPATTATQTFQVGKGSQTITVTSFPPAGATVGGSYRVLAKASSGLAVVVATSSAACTASAGVVHFVAVGSCVIVISQPGGANFLAAPSKSQTVPVGKGSQTIAFTSAPVHPTVTGTYTVTAKGGSSSRPVVFGSTTPTVCTVSGATVRFVGAGTCSISADQAADANYNAAATARQSFSVGKINQVITFTSTPTAPALHGTYAVSATGGGSSNPVTFASGAPTVCTVAGTLVSFVGGGTCLINASQAGTAVYNAGTASQHFSVAQGTQTITMPTPPNGMVGKTYTLQAHASSGLTVVFTVATPSTCRVSGATLSYLAVGTCTVFGNQAGSPSYQAAPAVSVTITVVQGVQSITITSTPLLTKVGSTYLVKATGGGSGIAVLFASTTPTVCTVSGSTVTLRAAGTCRISADQAGNANWAAAVEVFQAFVVKP
jgi:hypothetical protein